MDEEKQRQIWNAVYGYLNTKLEGKAAYAYEVVDILEKEYNITLKTKQNEKAIKNKERQTTI